MQSMWKSSLHDRLLRRELGDRSSYSGIKGIYGSSEWIDDLDIVNELGGHTGCVNALRYAALPSMDFWHVNHKVVTTSQLVQIRSLASIRI